MSGSLFFRPVPDSSTDVEQIDPDGPLEADGWIHVGWCDEDGLEGDTTVDDAFAKAVRMGLTPRTVTTSHRVRDLGAWVPPGRDEFVVDSPTSASGEEILATVREFMKPDWLIVAAPDRTDAAHRAAKGLPKVKVLVNEHAPEGSLMLFNLAGMRGEWPPGTFD